MKKKKRNEASVIVLCTFANVPRHLGLFVVRMRLSPHCYCKQAIAIAKKSTDTDLYAQ